MAAVRQPCRDRPDRRAAAARPAGRAGIPGPDRAGQRHADGALPHHRSAAFSFLVRTSQDSNRTLVDIATDVIRTGHSPTETAQDLPLRNQTGPGSPAPT